MFPVLYDEASRSVIATAKSPTTHHDLAIGICGAIDAVLALADVAPERIELVSLSTTLATNALVEGKGRPVGAVIIGFDGVSTHISRVFGRTAERTAPGSVIST